MSEDFPRYLWLYGLETVLTVGLAKSANLVSFGLGTAPDFDPSKLMLRAVEAAGSSVG